MPRRRTIAVIALILVAALTLFEAFASEPMAISGISDPELNRDNLFWQIAASATITLGGLWSIIEFVGKILRERREKAREKEIATFRESVRADVAAAIAASDLRADIARAAMRAELQAEIKDSREDIKGDIGDIASRLNTVLQALLGKHA